MVNTKSMQIFLSSEKSENDILDLLGVAVGFLVESTGVDIQGAMGFAQISSYTQGFEQGILVTWPSAIELALSLEEIVKSLAVRLNVSALLEPSENGQVWLLAKPDGSVSGVDVNYLDDGIEVSGI